ncbi:MAG: hypothetical protein IJM17_04515 [Firmicutes bacterium]|nr:hypothetical protein [Bacillota bacterium]
MFIEAINAGLSAGETGVSRDEAKRLIAGGLLCFLADLQGGRDPGRCASHLYCLAKLCCALCGPEKDRCMAMLMVCASLDGGPAPDIKKAVGEYLGLSGDALDAALKTVL